MSNLEPTESSISKFIDEQMKSRSDHQDVAFKAGYNSDNAILMFIRGETRVPLDRVPALASALGCDGAHLFKLAVQQYFSAEIYQQFEALFKPTVPPTAQSNEVRKDGFARQTV